MGIYIAWDTPAQTAVRLDFEGKWTWLDFDYVMNQSADLIKQVSHPVDIILNIQNSGPLAAGAVMELRDLRQPMPQNRGALIAVGEDHFARAIMEILTRVYGELGEEYYVASSLDAARASLKKTA
jgi:hypothetical protein